MHCFTIFLISREEIVRLTWNFNRMASWKDWTQTWGEMKIARWFRGLKYSINVCIDILLKLEKKSEVPMKYIWHEIFPTKRFPIDLKFFVHSLGYRRVVGLCCEDTTAILTCSLPCLSQAWPNCDMTKRAKWPHFWTSLAVGIFFILYSVIPLVSLVITIWVSWFLWKNLSGNKLLKPAE